MRAIERVEPRCWSCGSLLPRPAGDPAVGFGFNGEVGSSDYAFTDVRLQALDEKVIACGDCGKTSEAVFWRVQT